MDNSHNLAIIIMGVSGSGKTTIGKLLSVKTGIPFFDGDDFHSPANIQKMSSGQPLTDDDRKDWLLRLQQLIIEQHQLKGCIIACSALKDSYREMLTNGEKGNTRFVFLYGTYEEILQRMKARQHHFIPTSLLQSQFDTLEIPIDALQIPISKTPDEIVDIVIAALL